MSEVLAPVNAMRTTLLIIGLLMLVLVSVVILLVANKLTKPIRTVTEAAERVAEGDVDVKVDIESNDEVGRLAHVVPQTRSPTCARRRPPPRRSPAAT